MAVLLILVFIAFLNHFRMMFYGHRASEASAVGRISPWCVAPMAIALGPLVVFGFWWPTAFWTYFESAAGALGMVTP
jgi:hydrogenase-4 component F